MMFFWLVVLLTFSIIWGRGVLFMKTHGISKKVSLWLMRYIMKPYFVIEDALLNIYYNCVGLLGIVLFAIVFKVPLFRLVLISLDNCKYIIIAPLAVLAFANIIITIITPIFKSEKIVSSMMNVPWINFTSRVNPKIGPLIPFVGALLEEIFFRGVVFYYAYYMCEIPFVLSLLISLIMFGIQQGVFTTNSAQFMLMFCGAVIVSIISCTVMALSNSLIPALLAHEIFIIFYFSKMGFEYKATSRGRLGY